MCFLWKRLGRIRGTTKLSKRFLLVNSILLVYFLLCRSSQTNYDFPHTISNDATGNQILSEQQHGNMSDQDSFPE